MKMQIRKGVWETNSSSIHAICMCSQNDFDKWENGELIYDRWDRELVPTKDAILDEGEHYRYYTYDDFFNDYDKMEFETYSDTFDTANGETVVAFGYYGHD